MQEGQHPAVYAHQLTVARGHKDILKNLSLAVRPGTVTGLIGPSGGGKTTLMRAITGVQKYKGTLTVLGLAAGSRPLRSQIGYVAQTPAVYGDLTVTQNLRYFASIVGVGKKEVEQTIQAVELVEQAKQRVESLSGGQYARVSLAVALLGSPELLVLDEPTVGLDPLLREELWNLFAKLAATGKTLLISSHVMDEADRCDELLLIRDGKLLWNDTRIKLLQETRTHNVGAAFVAKIGETK